VRFENMHGREERQRRKKLHLIIAKRLRLFIAKAQALFSKTPDVLMDDAERKAQRDL